MQESMVLLPEMFLILKESCNHLFEILIKAAFAALIKGCIIKSEKVKEEL